MKSQTTELEKTFAKHLSEKDLYPEYIKNSKHWIRTYFNKMSKRYEQTFYQRYSMANKHMKRSSTSLLIREMINPKNPPVVSLLTSQSEPLQWCTTSSTIHWPHFTSYYSPCSTYTDLWLLRKDSDMFLSQGFCICSFFYLKNISTDIYSALSLTFSRPLRKCHHMVRPVLDNLNC